MNIDNRTPFRMTVAEIEVLTLLHQGVRLIDIARQRGKSYSATKNLVYRAIEKHKLLVIESRRKPVGGKTSLAKARGNTRMLGSK